MRRVFIAGNWKMNLTRDESIALARAVSSGVKGEAVEVAVCPPLVYLEAVRSVLADTHVGLGAQNMYDRPNGAFTGEVSGEMLRDVGCRYVILGHSERRQLMGETNEQVKHKVVRALEVGLVPIVCVGETLEQRQAGRTADVVRDQFVGSLGGLSAQQMGQVVIAYEPVWAIGTGVVATPQQAEEVHADLRSLLESHYNAAIASQTRIQYGGSVKPDNAAELLGQPNIDGALVGGASLKPDSFLGIISAGAAG